MQNSIPKSYQNGVQIGFQKRPQKRCKTHLFFDPGRFSRENPLGDPKMVQKSKQKHPQIGTKMGTRSAPGKKSKINAKTVKIHRKYVDLNDFQPPQKAPEKRLKRTIKKTPFWLPKPGFRPISLGPPLFVWFGHGNGPKIDRKSVQKWTPKRTSKRHQKKSRKNVQNDTPKLNPFPNLSDK